MTDFKAEYQKLFERLGQSKKMVLSTSLNDNVSSRMMSIIIIGQEFFFQTDNTFKKYKQIIGNSSVALCIDNIQIEGICHEIGAPCNHQEFVKLYKEHFLSSYNRYTHLRNERLFKVTPSYVKIWSYIDSKPYMQIYDIINQQYQIIEYKV